MVSQQQPLDELLLLLLAPAPGCSARTAWWVLTSISSLSPCPSLSCFPLLVASARARRRSVVQSQPKPEEVRASNRSVLSHSSPRVTSKFQQTSLLRICSETESCPVSSRRRRPSSSTLSFVFASNRRTIVRGRPTLACFVF